MDLTHIEFNLQFRVGQAKAKVARWVGLELKQNLASHWIQDFQPFLVHITCTGGGKFPSRASKPYLRFPLPEYLQFFVASTKSITKPSSRYHRSIGRSPRSIDHINHVPHRGQLEYVPLLTIRSKNGRRQTPWSQRCAKAANKPKGSEMGRPCL